MNALFYDSLRALGPIQTADVPEAIASQIVATGAFTGDRSQAKAAIALYSQLASQLDREAFQAAVIRGELPSGVNLTQDEMDLASAGGRSCCGHTCEGTCTPGR